jgi:diadenosine tetraphosphatase ApaH/serine/threonine PP2A family protein phosphatase
VERVIPLSLMIRRPGGWQVKAILSDIHGNLEALHAVLGDIAGLGVDSIDNLGDITGYGPDPIACIELTMSMAIVLQGEFDDRVVHGLEGCAYSLHAGESIEWTRNLLMSSTAATGSRRSSIAYLASLPISHSEGETLYVHGSPVRQSELVSPEDIHNQAKMERIGEKIEHVCFNGHTHIQGIFVEYGSEGWRYFAPEECGEGFRIDQRKVLCNVGSIGQPRDGDWRAGYVLYDGTTIAFRRVEYDIAATIDKIYSVPELANFLGDRLRLGR